VQKRLNQLIYCVDCGLGWVKEAQVQLYLPGCASVPNNTAMSCAETAEMIDLPFGLWTQLGQRKHSFNRIRQVAPMCQWQSTLA